MSKSHRFGEKEREWIPTDKPKAEPTAEPKDQTNVAAAGGSQTTEQGKQSGKKDL